MKINVPMSKRVSSKFTHEGAPVKHINYEQQLRRSVFACLLWESQFYENGEDIATRISSLVAKVKPEVVAELAITAREKMKLRHVPLLLVREMARLDTHKFLVAETLSNVIQRADELTEFLALYWKDGKQPISAQVKKGLAKAFCKFDEYQLAKYNRDNAIKLRDVLFLCHAKPQSPWGGEIIVRSYKNGGTGRVARHTQGPGHLWKKMINNDLEIPYTWETEFSDIDNRLTKEELETVQKYRQELKACAKSKSKKQMLRASMDEVVHSHKGEIWKNLINEILRPYKAEIWRNLIESKKIGALALLRNLRNMQDAGIDKTYISEALKNANTSRVFPYRFITAARHAPDFEPALEVAMMNCLKGQELLPGKTILLVDVSGSMIHPMSTPHNRPGSVDSTLRLDAACGLAVLIREICEESSIFSFSERLIQVPPRSGFALRDAIVHSQYHSSTYLGRAITELQKTHSYDRIIVITDEQSADVIPNPSGLGYVINVASYKHGVGYGKWNHIDGFSESVIDWIRDYEKLPMV